MKSLSAVTTLWSFMGRSVCANERGEQDTSWPGDQEPAPIPPRPLRRSHSGSSWLPAGPRGRTHIHTPRWAASLPPSSPFPSPCSRRPFCAARAAQSAARKGTGARGRAPRGRGGPGSRLAPALSSPDPAQTASIPSPTPDSTHPPRPRARMRTQGQAQSRCSTL